MELYHSSIKVSDDKGTEEVLNLMATCTLEVYRCHLQECWPEIKDNIEIGFIAGTNGSEIGVSHSLGWDNKDLLSFVHNGLANPSAITNCKKYGISKFIICYDGEVMELLVEEL